MHKAINLRTTVPAALAPGGDGSLEQALLTAFATANPGLGLTITQVGPPDAHGKRVLRVAITGEQAPAADFAKLTRTALRRAIAICSGAAQGQGASGSPPPLGPIREDAAAGGPLVLPPIQAAPPPEATPPGTLRPPDGGGE